MAVLEIVQIGHPVLREVARNVSVEDIQSEDVQTIDDLVETMRAANGAGLAATQVARPLRICAVEVKAGNPRYPYKPAIPLRVMINPEIEPMGPATFLNYEGCLSVPNFGARCHATKPFDCAMSTGKGFLTKKKSKG